MTTLNLLRGRHKGPALVMGSGPSLRHLTDRPPCDIAIAVNSAILKAPWADYFVSCDGRVTHRTSFQTLAHLNTICLLMIEGIGDYWTRTNKVDSSRLLWFRRDEVEVVKAYSSAHMAVALAILMGCRHVKVMGCECAYEDGKKYFYEFGGQINDEWLPGQYVIDGPKHVNTEVTTDGFLAASKQAWNRMREAYPEVLIEGV